VLTLPINSGSPKQSKKSSCEAKKKFDTKKSGIKIITKKMINIIHWKLTVLFFDVVGEKPTIDFH
jgi:hypothetical protein